MTMDVRASDPVTRAIEILTKLVGFATVSSGSNLALVEYVETLLGKLGIAAERIRNDGGDKANLFAIVGPERPDGVILSGHTDVVPVTGQSWTSDPYLLSARDGRLYGRGSADMKAFLACSLAALEFADLDALERPIYLAFSYDEEIGCLGAPRLIEHALSRIVHPAVAIVGEPSSMRIIGSHKSVHLFRVQVTGVPAHSSTPHLGVSANHVAIRLMSSLVRTADALRREDQQDASFDPPFTTLTIGQMQGGTAANILAADASFVFDLRCLPRHQPDDVLQAFVSEIESLRRAYPKAGIDVVAQAAVPSLTATPDSPAERLVRTVGGDDDGMLTASYGAEAGQFQQAGFSTVICGPGSMEQGHQPDEYIEVDQIAQCMTFMERLFASMSRSQVAA